MRNRGEHLDQIAMAPNATAAADVETRVPAGLETRTLNEALRQTAPVNLARAYEVMEDLDLSGIVVGDPLNVFHFTGFWPQIARTKTGQPPTTFALLSRNAEQPRGFVTSHFSYYYTYCDCGFASPCKPFLFADSGDDGSDGGQAPAAAVLGFTDRGLVSLSAIERRRREGLDAALAQNFIRHDAGAALVAAMRELGLWSGTIAFDDAVIASVCAHHERPGRLIPADNILRSIRMVKSPLEIALMRRASWANVEAVHAAAQHIRRGVSYGDIRAAYYQAAVARWNMPVFMTIDRASNSLLDERVDQGHAFFIDGVSHYQHYHGDYARTVFVGEPVASMKRATAAISIGWEAVRERLKPGLRYSEISRIGNTAVRKAGYDFSIGFGPHSVGLSHTDEPARNAGGFYVKDDLVLRENMILSVDCPIVDTGLGGSAHIEDLMLITHDGAEPLHPLRAPVIVV